MSAIVSYRLYDIAYTFDLDRVSRILNTSHRVRPGRMEAAAIQIKNPPVDAQLALIEIPNLGQVAFSVRVFDFGVCSLRAEIEVGDCDWPTFVENAKAAVEVDLSHHFTEQLHRLTTLLDPAAERPAVSAITEVYTVFRFNGAAADVSMGSVEPLMLRESRTLAPAARTKLLANRFSYYENDFTIVTWDDALLVDPNGDRDVEYVLEFANAQLLQLRVYDEMLDAALPAMYDSIAAARARRGPLLRRRYRPVLTTLQALVADVTETIEHSDNAFKITDDVYFAEIYDAALRLFRSGPWRSAIERKLAIVRETYAMLDAEAQASRMEIMEIAIVLLILAEFIRSLF